MTKRSLMLLPLLLAITPPALGQDPVAPDGCAPGAVVVAGELEISGAFTRATLPQARTGGAYLVIANHGAAADRLLGAATAAAQRAELHEMRIEGEMMKMQELPDGIKVPAGGSVSLSPGGLHIMLMGIAAPLAEGECLELTLQFERAGAVPVPVAVGSAAAAAAPEGHADHH